APCVGIVPTSRSDRHRPIPLDAQRGEKSSGSGPSEGEVDAREPDAVTSLLRRRMRGGERARPSLLDVTTATPASLVAARAEACPSEPKKPAGAKRLASAASRRSVPTTGS